MKKAAWFVIWLVVTFLYVHVCIWIANNHPIYVSVPVIWITMSIWGCVWWWRFNLIYKDMIRRIYYRNKN